MRTYAEQINMVNISIAHMPTVMLLLLRRKIGIHPPLELPPKPFLIID